MTTRCSPRVPPSTSRPIVTPSDGSSRSQPTTLLIAYDAAGGPVGFVSGAEMTHPDKGREMFGCELGVDPQSGR